MGFLPVADRELDMAWVVDDEKEAAAAPTKTMDIAMMRMASFIVGNLTWIYIGSGSILRSLIS